MNKPCFLIAVGVASLLASGCARLNTETQPLPIAGEPAMQKPQKFRKQITRAVKLDYLLYLPEGYQKSGPSWPLMLFLHGAGERGTNVQKVAVHGPPKLVQAGTQLPFIIASPQCPEGRTWQDDELLALLDDLTARLNVDTNRVYLTGLSMGGYGTWSLGTKYPERFAAIAPICGGGERIHVLLASRGKKALLNSMGVWAFHGGKDSVVPLEESQRMTNALVRAGGKDVKLTVYPEVGHDSWVQAYSELEIWNWFLAHRRN